MDLCVRGAEQYNKRCEVFHVPSQHRVPSEATGATGAPIETLHQWTIGVEDLVASPAPLVYAAEDVRCSCRQHLVPRSRLVLLAGKYAVCAECAPGASQLGPGRTVDPELWTTAFSRLRLFSEYELVDNFLMYTARVFFFRSANQRAGLCRTIRLPPGAKVFPSQL